MRRRGFVVLWRMPSVVCAGVLAMLMVWPLASVRAETAPTILPPRIELSGPSARQQVVVEEVDDDRFVGQRTEGLKFTSSDPKVVVIRDGVAVPVGNGAAKITVDVDGRVGKAEVSVAGMDKPFVWSFRNHVQSVLAKAGCNSGACHGALAGKKGLKLSLRGFDAERDHNTLTRQARGRRVDLADPGRSLVLTKPTTAIAHGGGERFPVDSPEYRVLADWIAAGAPAPKADDPRIERLEILPDSAVLKPNVSQQVLVRAHFSDGHVEDVTRWTKYTATNGEVAKVDDLGKVNVIGHGEGAVTAWYLNKLAVATITVPYDQQTPSELYAKTPPRNFIDEQVIEKLQALDVPPSPICDDSAFLRRAFLDAIGVLPTVEETKAFLADQSADKRDKLIDRLLERPEFVDYWAYKWSDLLLVNSSKLKPQAMWSYYNWIRNHVAANTPWDRLARELVTAQGDTLQNGAANFFVLHQDTRVLNETVSVAFLGMSIECARCHNHPLEKWTLGQYYGMANLLARVRVKDAPGDGNFTVFVANDGEIVQPVSGKAEIPRPLDGEPIPIDAAGDRRNHLADWLTAPENPYFARAIANRVWANFLGVGVVEKVDDLRMTNPASNPKLLQALADRLVEHRFDLKRLMRDIMRSNTYQRTSTPLPGNAAEKRFYARYYVKRLMAEVMIDALAQVTESPTEFPGYPADWRALQLPDSNVASYFLQKFGRPDRVRTCDCERTNEPSMVQVLHIANGDTINSKLTAKGNRIDRLLAAKTAPADIIDDLYLAALCRPPSESERAALLAALPDPGSDDYKIALEDLYWSVLSSKEFLFNH